MRQNHGIKVRGLSLNQRAGAIWSYGVLTFSLLLACFTNCSKSFKAIPAGTQSLSSQILDSSSTSAPQISSKTAGVTDANCQNNNSFDACIVWKNPVASAGRVFPQILQRSTDLSAIQTFGVALKNRTSPDKLISSTITVSASAGTTPVFQNGQLRTTYQSDSEKSWLAQLMAYFWISYQESEMTRRTGGFYPTGKAIPVDAFATDPTKGSVVGNAYYSSTLNKVVLGYAVDENQVIAHEMALSAEVYLHEMGHADLEWALDGSGIDIYRDPNASYVVQASDGTNHLRSLNDIQTGDVLLSTFCKTVDGCMWAINEGQADFHYLMIFHDSTPLAETIVNKVAGGLETGTVPRDVNQLKTWSTQDIFTKSASKYNSGSIVINGEIHGMGSAYASILWTIYTHPQMNRTHFEKIFMEQLKMLTPNSRFQDARESLVGVAEAMADSNLNGIHYGPLIRSIFTAKGVAP